jgi:hypothetical protein
MSKQVNELNFTFSTKELSRLLDEKIANGEIKMEIRAGENGERLDPACFTIDKRKYSIRFSDETEESVKVWIEPIL